MSPAANFGGKRKRKAVAESTSGNTAKPKRGRPFKPGQSGNPAGKPKGTLNRATLMGKEFWARAMEDQDYLYGLLERLKNGELAPAVETMGWHYYAGKPKETVSVDVTHQPQLEALTTDELLLLERLMAKLAK